MRAQIENKGIEEFIKMISLDFEAVANALNKPWNNGLLEGTVNITKRVKRIMFGRTLFKLLKVKLIKQNAT